MTRKLLILVAFSISGLLAGAQHGSAPSGFYPTGYHGDTFSGVVTAAGERGLTLAYTHKGKTEVFTGITDGPCMVAKKTDLRMPVEMPLTAVPKGSTVTLFYNHAKLKQPDGSKKEINLILFVRFDEINGKKYTDPERPLIPCTQHAWGGPGYH